MPHHFWSQIRTLYMLAKIPSPSNRLRYSEIRHFWMLIVFIFCGHPPHCTWLCGNRNAQIGAQADAYIMHRIHLFVYARPYVFILHLAPWTTVMRRDATRDGYNEFYWVLCVKRKFLPCLTISRSHIWPWLKRTSNNCQEISWCSVPIYLIHGLPIGHQQNINTIKPWPLPDFA